MYLRVLFLIFLPFLLQAGSTQSSLKKDPRDGTFSIGNRPTFFTSSVNANARALTRNALPVGEPPVTRHEIAKVEIRQLFESLIMHLPVDQQQFTLLELSHTYTGWGKAIGEAIQKKEIKVPEGLRIQIISINQATDDLAIKRSFGCCEYLELSKFTIDNLHNDIHEVAEIDLKGACDMIVAADVLNRLIDPLGVFCHLHFLLRPGKGVLFANGFPIYDENTIKHLNNGNFYDHMNVNLHAFLLATGMCFMTQCKRDRGQSYDAIGDIILWRKDEREIQLPNFYGYSLHKNGNAGLSCTYDLSKITALHVPGTRDYEKERGGYDFWGDEELCAWFFKNTASWHDQSVRNYYWTEKEPVIRVFEITD